MEIDTKLFTKFRTICLADTFYLLNPNDRYISETLLNGMVWEKYIQTILYLLVNKNDVVVDVGANIGIHTMTLSKLVGESGTVHAFEPVPLLFTQLSCHCLVNKCFNVKLYQSGLSQKCSESFIPQVAVEDMEEKINWGNTKLSETRTSSVDLKVSTKPFDFYNINPQLIKIDVEGMELEVLKGMRDTLHRCHPFLIVEIADLKPIMDYIEQECDLFFVYNIWTSVTNRKHDYILVPKDKHDYFLNKVDNCSYPYFKLIRNSV